MWVWGELKHLVCVALENSCCPSAEHQHHCWTLCIDCIDSRGTASDRGRRAARVESYIPGNRWLGDVSQPLIKKLSVILLIQSSTFISSNETETILCVDPTSLLQNLPPYNVS